MGRQAVISVTPEEEQTLRQWTRAGTVEHRLVERAKVILLASQGKANLEIARQLKTGAGTQISADRSFAILTPVDEIWSATDRSSLTALRLSNRAAR